MDTGTGQVDISKIKYLDQLEWNQLLRAVKNIRDYAILTISYNHGLRIAECALLQLDSWNPESGRIFIKRVKNGISASYRVSEETNKALKNWIKIRGDEPGPLFKSVRTGKGLTRSGLDQIFRKHARKANLPKDKQHFHTLRHSIAVDLVNKDVPIMQIKDWLGHRNIQNTIIYAQVSDKKRDETADRLGDIVQKKIDWSKNKIRR